MIHSWSPRCSRWLVCAAQAVKQAPAWLKRPCSVAFGFGGILASFCNSNTVSMSQVWLTQLLICDLTAPAASVSCTTSMYHVPACCTAAGGSHSPCCLCLVQPSHIPSASPLPVCARQCHVPESKAASSAAQARLRRPLPGQPSMGRRQHGLQQHCHRPLQRSL